MQEEKKNSGVSRKPNRKVPWVEHIKQQAACSVHPCKWPKSCSSLIIQYLCVNLWAWRILLRSQACQFPAQWNKNSHWKTPEFAMAGIPAASLIGAPIQTLGPLCSRKALTASFGICKGEKNHTACVKQSVSFSFFRASVFQVKDFIWKGNPV